MMGHIFGICHIILNTLGIKMKEAIVLKPQYDNMRHFRDYFRAEGETDSPLLIAPLESKF